jgi:hypothetical protein
VNWIVASNSSLNLLSATAVMKHLFITRLKTLGTFPYVRRMYFLFLHRLWYRPAFFYFISRPTFLLAINWSPVLLSVVGLYMFRPMNYCSNISQHPLCPFHFQPRTAFFNFPIGIFLIKSWASMAKGNLLCYIILHRKCIRQTHICVCVCVCV